MAKTKKVLKKATVKKPAVKKAAKKVVKKVAAVKKNALKKVATKKVVATKKITSKKKVVAKKTLAKKVVVKKVAKSLAKKSVKKMMVKKSAVVKKISSALKIKIAVKKEIIKATPSVSKKMVSKTKKTISKSKVKSHVAMSQPNNNPEDSRTKYSEVELKEFEDLINDKLDKAKKELKYIKESLSRKSDESSDNSNSNLKLLEDGADTLEKENFSQLAARQMKFIQQLEFAIMRIKNGTYGVCIETGKLIPKERLRAVPHTQHTIEAKLNRK